AGLGAFTKARKVLAVVLTLAGSETHLVVSVPKVKPHTPDGPQVGEPCSVPLFPFPEMSAAVVPEQSVRGSSTSAPDGGVKPDPLGTAVQPSAFPEASTPRG